MMHQYSGIMPIHTHKWTWNKSNTHTNTTRNKPGGFRESWARSSTQMRIRSHGKSAIYGLFLREQFFHHLHICFFTSSQQPAKKTIKNRFSLLHSDCRFQSKYQSTQTLSLWHIYVYIHMYIYMYMFMNIYTRRYIWKHMYVEKVSAPIFKYVYIYRYMYTYIHKESIYPRQQQQCVAVCCSVLPFRSVSLWVSAYNYYVYYIYTKKASAPDSNNSTRKQEYVWLHMYTCIDVCIHIYVEKASTPDSNNSTWKQEYVFKHIYTRRFMCTYIHRASIYPDSNNSTWEQQMQNIEIQNVLPFLLALSEYL